LRLIVHSSNKGKRRKEGKGTTNYQVIEKNSKKNKKMKKREKVGKEGGKRIKQSPPPNTA